MFSFEYGGGLFIRDEVQRLLNMEARKTGYPDYVNVSSSCSIQADTVWNLMYSVRDGPMWGPKLLQVLTCYCVLWWPGSSLFMNACFVGGSKSVIGSNVCVYKCDSYRVASLRRHSASDSVSIASKEPPSEAQVFLSWIDKVFFFKCIEIRGTRQLGKDDIHSAPSHLRRS